MRGVYTACLFCILSLHTMAQQPFLFFHQLTRSEGLSQSTNHFLQVDSEGLVWIGSMDGLNIFDGRTVRIFRDDPTDSLSILGDNIQSNFFEDAFGNMWFTTDKAINCYRRSEGSFQHDFAKGQADTSTHQDRHYAFFLESKRYLWLEAYNGLYRYDTQQPAKTERTPLVAPFYGPRSAVQTCPDGTVERVFACFFVQKGMEVIQFSTDLSLQSRDTLFREEYVTNALMESPERMLIVSSSGQYHLYLPDYRIDTLAFSPELQSGIKDIQPFNDSHYGLLSNASEFHLIPKSHPSEIDQRFRLINADTQEPLEKVNLFLGVADSVVWVAVPDQGIYYAHLDNTRFYPVFTANKIPPRAIHHLYQDEHQTIWAVADDGEAWTFDSRFQLLKKENLAYYSRLSGRDGTIYTISSNGIGVSEQDGTFTYTNLQAAGSLYHLVDYNEKWLLLAGYRGIFAWNKSHKTLSGPIHRVFTVSLFLDSDQRLWTASANGELSVWHFQALPLPTLEPVKTLPDLIQIHHITEDIRRGVIWVATSRGLVQINSRTLDYHWIKKTDGLPHEFLYATVVDRSGTIWLASNAGIIQYLPEAVPEKRFTAYSTRQGLSSNEFHIGAGLLTHDGTVLFGSTQGVDVIRPEQMRPIGQAPQLRIRSLHVNGRPWQGDSCISRTPSIVLGPKENTLLFELGALEYTDPSRNTYTTFLHHAGKTDTVANLTDNEVRFSSLQPGTYYFSFIAANSEGLWQQTPNEFKFTILPPFYQTWWFRTLVILMALALVSFVTALYYRYRLGLQQLQLEKQQREAERKEILLEKKLSLQNQRIRIAHEMHDEMGGGLSSITNAASRALRKKDPQVVDSILTRIGNITQELVKSMHIIIWSMDPDNDSLQHLIAKLRRHTMEFLNDNEMSEIKLHLPEQIPDQELNGEFRHNILLVAKEALHNVVKHAEASQVLVSVEIDQQFHMEISDNGKGFDRELVNQKGYGLNSMQKRVKAIGGEICWKHNSPTGTRLLVRVPLQPHTNGKAHLEGATKG